MKTIRNRIAVERIPAPLASLYEKASKMVIDTYYNKVADEITSSIRSGNVLDLGTGPGYLPIEIVKRAPDIRIDCIDLSARLLKTAKLNAENSGVSDKLNFEVGDASKLRFEDNSYDMVISTGMLHSLKAPEKMIAECHRVLKPGKEAWIYDPAEVCSRIDVKKWKTALSNLEKVLLIFFILYSKISPPHFYNREQITKLADTSFKEYSIEELGNSIKVKLIKEQPDSQ